MKALLFLSLASLAHSATPLAKLAQQQQWPELSRALAAKEQDVDFTLADGSTALLWAAYHDHAPAVTELLAAGAKPDLANHYQASPLSAACQNGSSAIVTALLAAGASAETQQAGDETALMLASRTGVPAVVKALLEKGAKVNAQAKSGQTALMWAAAEGHAHAIKLLAAHGADLRQRLDSGFTPLLFAAREGHSSAVAALLALGVPADEAIETTESTGGRDAPPGTSALHLAVENGHFELAIQLVKAGAEPNDVRCGYTPLHTLTWVRKPPRGDDEAGQPPPDTTGPLSSLDFITALVAAGAKVDAELNKSASSRDTSSIRYAGATPFFLACRTADLAMMQRLVELGADPHRANHEGSTPLMAAAGLGCHAPDEEAGTEAECLTACEYLLSLGAKVDAVDHKGQTAMHGAAYKSLPRVVSLLAKHGADPRIWHRANHKGWTPLLIAQGFRPGNFKPSEPTMQAISQILRSAGIEPPPAPDRQSLPVKRGYSK